MSLSLVKAIALGSALFLALPAGWCCGGWQLQDGGDANARSACPACSQQAPAETGPSPSPPETDCTCDLHAAVLLKQPARLAAGDWDDAPAAHAAPALLWRGPGDLFVAAPETTGSRAGPRLHVLKCVWRC